eukprot:CAMPEP_0184298492 /NCGR_PEP_ID=MMETSP1049-20130417/9292_1 /TAXON_ID=77928 /ORGANISM="Proteomonas sulcata, Strain CCMP704" /LENGTH=64 /DNA_ID=CAMNT_0026608645 /DNA_START=490 /DNA_END=684 /DNA_ORIENTATION=-
MFSDARKFQELQEALAFSGYTRADGTAFDGAPGSFTITDVNFSDDIDISTTAGGGPVVDGPPSV